MAGRRTEDRLIDEGLRHFARDGFRGTTVGAIEAAAGLVPRRGGLYRHFGSKQALLEAAVDRHVRAIESVSGVVELFPLADLRSELTLLFRWLLLELGRQGDLVRTLEKEGDQVPELVERFWSHVGESAYGQAAELARRHLKDLPELGGVDVEVLAAVAVGAVVNYRRSQWTFSHAPLELDEERFVLGLVELLAGTVERIAQGSRTA